MSAETDILEVEQMMKDIEEYVGENVWNPDRNSKAVKEIAESDLMLENLMTGHIMGMDVLSSEQVKQVLNLGKRLEKAKCGLPSPPCSRLN